MKSLFARGGGGGESLTLFAHGFFTCNNFSPFLLSTTFNTAYACPVTNPTWLASSSDSVSHATVIRQSPNELAERRRFQARSGGVSKS